MASKSSGACAAHHPGAPADSPYGLDGYCEHGYPRPRTRVPRTEQKNVERQIGRLRLGFTLLVHHYVQGDRRIILRPQVLWDTKPPRHAGESSS